MDAEGEILDDAAFHAKWKEQRWVETTREGDFEGCIKDMGINAAGAKILNFATAVKPGSEYTLKVVDGAPLPRRAPPRDTTRVPRSVHQNHT